ncbi:MAG: hypothetical protein IKB99_07785 [Lentisphaeria bacterium]|nr:hypothetical protein [Lentisphaeria bacterium]
MQNTKKFPFSNIVDADKENFKRDLAYTIDCCFCDEMAKSPNGKLSYAGAKTILANVRALFKERTGVIPAEVEKACLLSEAIVAPSRKAKIKLLKAAGGIGGSIACIVAIISQIGIILGWGKGVTAAVTAFFVGTSFTAQYITIGIAAGVMGLALYFIVRGSDAERTEKFIKALKRSCCAAVDSVWDEYGDKLAAA